MRQNTVTHFRTPAQMDMAQGRKPSRHPYSYKGHHIRAERGRWYAFMVRNDDSIIEDTKHKLTHLQAQRLQLGDA